MSLESSEIFPAFCVTKTPLVLFLLTLSPVLYRLYLLGLPSAESYSDPIYEGLEL